MVRVFAWRVAASPGEPRTNPARRRRPLRSSGDASDVPGDRNRPANPGGRPADRPPAAWNPGAAAFCGSPGTAPGPEVQTDAELLDYAQRFGSTTFHPTSTCRMERSDGGGRSGAARDRHRRTARGGCVGDADGGSATPNAAAIMIGEKAADLVRGERGRQHSNRRSLMRRRTALLAGCASGGPGASCCPAGRAREAAVGRVGTRFTGGSSARRISRISVSIAAARLRSCVRWRCAVITSSPVWVRRFPASRARRVHTSSGNPDAARTRRSCTALATLLTFCPPGPEARTNVSVMARSST